VPPKKALIPGQEQILSLANQPIKQKSLLFAEQNSSCVLSVLNQPEAQSVALSTITRRPGVRRPREWFNRQRSRRCRIRARAARRFRRSNGRTAVRIGASCAGAPPESREQDLDRDLRAHLELEVEEQQESGLTLGCYRTLY
jgi:hypothetical protein